MSPVTCQLTTFNPRTDFALSNGFRSPASDYLSGAMFIAYAATWGPPPQASAGKTNQVNNNQPPTLRQRRPRSRDRGLFNFQPPVSSLARRRFICSTGICESIGVKSNSSTRTAAARVPSPQAATSETIPKSGLWLCLDPDAYSISLRTDWDRLSRLRGGAGSGSACCADSLMTWKQQACCYIETDIMSDCRRI